jgi:pimeloyl-ACP methyl ester carboxylesterase
MIEWSKQIPGAPDAELGIPRKTPVTYHCTSRDKSANGLIFVIHGFGNDTNSSHDKLLRRYIAETSGLLVVTVEYHCYHARPNSGARRRLLPETLERLAFLATKHGIPPPGEGDEILPHLLEIGKKSQEKIFLKGLLVPPSGDYQNFGVLQAMDHLVVLNDLVDSGFAFDANRIFLIGGSHGGYIGHLIARLAPNSILGLIDNSSYTVADPMFLGQGNEWRDVIGNIVVVSTVVTEWQFSDAMGPNYYGPSRAIFRDTGCYSHLLASANAAARKGQYLMFNTVVDEISPIQWKRHQLLNLQKAGFAASLKEITEDETGGDLFRSMEHADAPLQKLFEHAHGHFSDEETTLDRYLSTKISYDCFDRIYTIVHSDAPPYVELRIEQNPGY